MKKLFNKITAVAAIALLSLSVHYAAAQTPAVIGAKTTLSPNVRFQGADNKVPTGSNFSIDTGASVSGLLRRTALGAPIVATTNHVVTTTSMIVGSYTVVSGHGTLDVPRNVTVTVTAVSTADTMGTITVTGTDVNGSAITEVITPAAGSTVAGVRAFKTVSSVVGAGWVVAAGADSIVVGVGNLIGLPFALPDATSNYVTTLGTTLASSASTGTGTTATGSGTAVSVSTIDASGGTYNGTKKLFVLVDR